MMGADSRFQRGITRSACFDEQGNFGRFFYCAAPMIDGVAWGHEVDAGGQPLLDQLCRQCAGSRFIWKMSDDDEGVMDRLGHERLKNGKSSARRKGAGEGEDWNCTAINSDDFHRFLNDMRQDIRDNPATFMKNRELLLT